MNKSEAAAYLAGAKQIEGAEASSPTNLHVLSGEVVGVSDDGKVSIALDGVMFSEADTQSIEMDTIGGLEEGDIAVILLSGETGHAMVPLAIGGVGSTDRIVNRVVEVESDAEKIHDLEADELAASVAYINELTAESISVSDLSADKAYILYLTSNQITAESLQAASGYIADLTTNNVTAAQLTAAEGYIRTLTANDITTSIIVADHGIISTLDSHYAEIDLANVNTAWIEQGLIKDGAISDAMIGSMSANKLTAGTINASVINVTNLRTDNLLVSKVNGQPVLGGFDIISASSEGYSSKNPHNEGWYELVSNKFLSTAGGSFITGAGGIKIRTSNVTGGNFVLTEDTSIIPGKTYYTSTGEALLYDQAYIDALEESINSRIDGQIETWTVTDVPTLLNYPASNWTTDALKAEHVGDICYVVNASSDYDGFTYRFAYDNTTSTYMWVLITDNQVTAALQRISDLESFESSASTWITETDAELDAVRQGYTSISGRFETDEGMINAKVNVSDFNNVVSTVNSNSATITQLVEKVETNSENLLAVSNFIKSMADGPDTIGTDGYVTDSTPSTDSRTWGYSISSWMKDLAAGTYTLSWEVDTTTSNNNSGIYIYKNNGVAIWSKTGSESPFKSGGTGSTSFTLDSATTVGIAIKLFDAKVRFKLEKGSIATPWSYATYDQTTLSNTVNSVKQDTTSNSSKISNLTTTIGTNSDGTPSQNPSSGTIAYRTSALEQDLSGFHTTVTSALATEANQRKAVYGTCSTANNTQNKVVSCENFVLYNGVSIGVMFTYDNIMAAPTLNVNSTGAKTIKSYKGDSLAESEYQWAAGSYLSFTYDGTYWRLDDSGTVKNVAMARSDITQTADKIDMVVSDQSSSSQLVLTSDAINAVANNMTIKGSDNSTTVISGGKLQTGSIKSGDIAASSIVVGKINRNDFDTRTALFNPSTYGYCDTATGEYGDYFLVNCTDFELVNGAEITVLFDIMHTGGYFEMDVEDSGMKDVLINGMSAAPGNKLLFLPETRISFVFDSDSQTYSVLDKPTTIYGICASAANAYKKLVTNTDQVPIMKGTILSVTFTYGNTYTADVIDLLIGPNASYCIEYSVGNSEGFTWPAGAVVDFVFTGEQWKFLGQNNAAKTATDYVTEITSNGIMVHRSIDDTSGVKITSSVDIMRSGVSTANFGGSNGDTARVGKAEASGDKNFYVDSGGFYLRDYLTTLASFYIDDNNEYNQNLTTIESANGLVIESSVVSDDGTQTGKLQYQTGAVKYNDDGINAGITISADSDIDHHAGQNSEFKAWLSIRGGTAIYDGSQTSSDSKPVVSFSDPYKGYSRYRSLDLGKPSLVTNSKSVTTGTSDTQGPKLYDDATNQKLTPGRWLIEWLWVFDASSTSISDRSYETWIKVGTTEYNHIVIYGTNHTNTLHGSVLVDISSSADVYAYGKSNRAGAAGKTCYIRGIRQH